jgi:cytochrome c553
VSSSTVPTLAGRPAEELNRLLLEFKTDQRKGSVMNQHAKGYSEAELKQLADYFSAQRP